MSLSCVEGWAIRGAVSGALISVLVVSHASAQTAGGRNAQSLEASASVVASYDGDIPADHATLIPVGIESVGYSTLLFVDARYGWRGSKAQLGSSFSSALRHFQERGEFQSLTQTAGIGILAPLGRRATFTLNQSAAYSPALLYDLFPGAIETELGQAGVGPDYATTGEASYGYSTDATLRHGFSQRNALSVTAQLRHTDYENDILPRDSTSYEVLSAFTRALTKHTEFSVGYRYRRGDLIYGLRDATNPEPSWRLAAESGAEFTVAHSRPLSATRRAFVRLNVGPSRLDSLQAATDPLYRMSATVALGYQFAQRWQAEGTYSRGVEFIANLSEPVDSSGLTAALNGTLARQATFRGLVSYSRGRSAFDSSKPFDSYTGTLRLDWGLNELLTVHGEYLYYYYDFGSSGLPLPGTPAQMERNGVRVGVTLHVRPIRG
jgi:hypothetical protein